METMLTTKVESFFDGAIAFKENSVIVQFVTITTVFCKNCGHIESVSRKNTFVEISKDRYYAATGNIIEFCKLIRDETKNSKISSTNR